MKNGCLLCERQPFDLSTGRSKYRAALSLRLRLQPASLGTRFGPDDTGRWNRGATQGWFGIIAGIAHRRLSLQEPDDLFAGQRLIFEKSLGKGFKILVLLFNDPRGFGETHFHEATHFRIDRSAREWPWR